MSKSPAFQLYAADFYMDTVGWSNEIVGFYFRLLMAQWVNGSIPNDIEKLARIGGCIEGRKWRANVERMWRELCTKFVTLPDGNLVNKRLEETREKQNLFIEHQREKGIIRATERWAGHIATATKRLQPEGKPEDSSSSSSSSSKIKTIKLKISFDEGRFKDIPPAIMEKWRQVAPGISIPAEIAKAELWVISNPDKVRSRWTSFLSRWMVKAQENYIKYGGNGNGRTNTNLSDKRSTVQDEIDAGVAKATAIYNAHKAARADTGGTAGNDDAPDFSGRGA